MEDINFNLEEFEKLEGVAKKSDNRIWVIAVIILVGVLIGSYFLNKCSGSRMPEVKTDSVTYWKDMYHREHARTTPTVIESKEQLPASMQPEYDSLLKIYKISKKNLQEYAAALIEAKGHIETQLVPIHDTLHHHTFDTIVGEYKFDYSDKYVNLKGIVSEDSVSIDYTVEAPMHITQYWKRKWFAGAKQYFIDGYSDNTNVHISDLHDVQMKEKVPSKWGVGPMVGYDPFRQNVIIGVGVFYKVF